MQISGTYLTHGTLEQQLAAKDATWNMTYDFQDSTAAEPDEFSQCIQPNVNVFEPESMETLIFGIASSTSWPKNGMTPLDPALGAESHDSHISSTLSSLSLSALVQADLEQLFFDRVYQSAPIIHKARYITLMEQEDPLPACVCLRLAIRTSAAAFSARYHDIGERLYLETLQSLESLESNEHTLPWGAKNIQIEHIQSWLLLAVYEHMRMDKSQASSATSRALRLVQRCRLGDLDASDCLIQVGSHTTTATEEDFAVMEEKRRTFWLAFCFDRLLNTRDDLNWALPEEMIRMRVPASEASFQHSQDTNMPLLSEVMGEGNDDSLSPFATCVALMALYGCCATHRRLVSIAGGSGNESTKFWMRHNWLMSAIEKQRRLLQAPESTPNIFGDDPIAEQEELRSVYKQQAYIAAKDRTRVAESLLCFSGFKVHPFLPTVLVGFFDFSGKRRIEMSDPDATSESRRNIRAMTKVLSLLRDIHRSAKEIPDDVLDGLETTLL
ncbi:Abscisic acid cluster transcription factor abl7 [Plenodomus lingam]|uniref:Abscisic acid cluster transcription factor abl7 n=1 Tax=Leptosphaeria maculans TaxID=5022 RepID=UPI003327B696|nr:Abscisic acid cluster transcription factor abl7 [Plenodomus lingam]